MSDRVLVFGASVRAAAFSALRGGLTPTGADLFADVDLTRRCPARRVSDYPNEFLAVADRTPEVPCMYVGGLENYPDLVDALAVGRPLYGNPGHVLRRVRDPAELATVLAGGRFPFPDWQATADGLPRDGSWLRKGYRGSGGIRVAAWNEQANAMAADRTTAARSNDMRFSPLANGSGVDFDVELPDVSPDSVYYQRRIEGVPCAAVYVAAGGRAVLLGVTEQLTGTEWTGARPFRYAGSVGPLSLSPERAAGLSELGNTLSRGFGLVGLFGVDLIATRDEWWAIEVNPRYPASAEVLERSGRFSAVRLHVDACRQGLLPETPPRQDRRWYGKAILYAARNGIVGPGPAETMARLSARWPWSSVADIPAAETPILAGLPVLTVLAAATDRHGVMNRLIGRQQQWRQMLGDEM